MKLPGDFSAFKEKKAIFCLVVGGVTPPYTLRGPTTKKNTFLYVSSLIIQYPFHFREIAGIKERFALDYRCLYTHIYRFQRNVKVKYKKMS